MRSGTHVCSMLQRVCSRFVCRIQMHTCCLHRPDVLDIPNLFGRLFWVSKHLHSVLVRMWLLQRIHPSICRDRMCAQCPGNLCSFVRKECSNAHPMAQICVGKGQSCTRKDCRRCFVRRMCNLGNQVCRIHKGCVCCNANGCCMCGCCSTLGLKHLLRWCWGCCGMRVGRKNIGECLKYVDTTPACMTP
jgi:hypothetical protein